MNRAGAVLTFGLVVALAVKAPIVTLLASVFLGWLWNTITNSAGPR